MFAHVHLRLRGESVGAATSAPPTSSDGAEARGQRHSASNVTETTSRPSREAAAGAKRAAAAASMPVALPAEKVARSGGKRKNPSSAAPVAATAGGKLFGQINPPGSRSGRRLTVAEKAAREATKPDVPAPSGTRTPPPALGEPDLSDVEDPSPVPTATAAASAPLPIAPPVVKFPAFTMKTSAHGPLLVLPDPEIAERTLKLMTQRALPYPPDEATKVCGPWLADACYFVSPARGCEGGSLSLACGKATHMASVDTVLRWGADTHTLRACMRRADVRCVRAVWHLPNQWFDREVPRSTHRPALW